jgi:hypothetical protein
MARRLIFVMLAAVALAASGPGDARIKRSQSAKVEFKREHPCPANGATKGPCKGYVIDHVNPLACGGPDRPENMQWQTVAEGKAKDKWERKACAR